MMSQLSEGMTYFHDHFKHECTSQNTHFFRAKLTGSRLIVNALYEVPVYSPRHLIFKLHD